jgi:hypothetical protein
MQGNDSNSPEAIANLLYLMQALQNDTAASAGYAQLSF